MRLEMNEDGPEVLNMRLVRVFVMMFEPEREFGANGIIECFSRANDVMPWRLL